jgi:hypothetical protein
MRYDVADALSPLHVTLAKTSMMFLRRLTSIGTASFSVASAEALWCA